MGAGGPSDPVYNICPSVKWKVQLGRRSLVYFTLELASISYLQNHLLFNMIAFKQGKNKRLHVCVYVCVNIDQSVDVEVLEPGRITKAGLGSKSGKKILTRPGWVPFPPLCLTDSRLVAQRMHLRSRTHHSARGFGF